MSEDESNVEKKEEEKEAEQDAEATEGDAEDAKDEAPEPPKKRASRMSVPKAAKSPKKAGAGVKKKAPKKKQHPKTLDMVVEAIENLGDRKGSSVQAIKSYILQNFKTVRADMLKSMLRRALASGLESGAVTRPKGQAETQAMSGRYLLGKAAKRDEDEEVMPKESKRVQEAKARAKAKKVAKKKAASKRSPAKKPVAKKPVAKKASPSKAKKPVKKGKKGRK
ncbi:sperm-specific H1/protamine-like protein type 2 [Penaeus japonicus]|uniref:sperm-specific H1/protamine-like protein type 2 n=1 Tax=Penaeus japonicus TaxID=27405 RepID=UPI001C70DFF0|nr:sperm-specific H1/protamine-like protein type 2 [Penaeus japonicus]